MKDKGGLFGFGILDRTPILRNTIQSGPPPTAKAIRGGGLNWTWYQIEDGDDAVTFRLHREGHREQIRLLENDFAGKIQNGTVNPVRWERFPKWGLNGKFAWVFDRYDLCSDCVTAAVVAGKPMRKPRKPTKEEEKYERERSKHIIESIQKEKIEQIVKEGKKWILLNNGIPVLQVTDEEKNQVDEQIIQQFGKMPPHLQWKKIEYTS